MRIVIAVISIFIFLKTLFYGIYEWKEQNNKCGSIVIILIAIISLILPNVLVNLRVNISNYS